MENFIGKVIKIVSGDKGFKDTGYWIDDSKCKACYECESGFSQWNRRHHCRICGRVFCANCTRNSIPPPRESADQQWLRVCNYCYRVRQRSDQPAARAHHHHAGSRGSAASTLPHSGSLRQLLEAGSLTGAASSDGSSSSLGGARFKAGASPSRWSRCSSSIHRVSSGDLSWTVPPPLEDDFGMSLADRDARLLYQQRLEAGALSPDAASEANSLAEVHRQLFCAAADSHLRAVVEQLLMAESVPQPEVWAPIVSGAAQSVAAYLSPSQMYVNGQHDPRQSLKVKKVADVGQPEDTCVVTGVVVRKGLVHRKMRAYIEYPKVLLLSGSLEYQRETKKLSSFDLMDHDKQYLANAVARLSVVKPDVVLVEGSVARMAQEDLLARNISVAQKIKMKVLERLARAMGVRVAPTVEHLTAATAHLYLGDCKVFRVEAETISEAKQGAPDACSTAAAMREPPAEAVGANTGWTDAGSSSAEAASEGGTPSSQAAEPPPEPGPPLVAAAPAPGEPAQGGFATAAAAAAVAASQPEEPPRPAADEQGAKYTSLSAAMMMKALGSGPNAAAAVACVSAGSGVMASAMPFRSWASSVSTPAAAGGTPAAVAGGKEGPGSAALLVAPALTLATGPHPALGRTAPAPVPAGPPAPPQVTLMYFEGCRPTTSTVLLKGAGLELLRRLKPVLGFAVLTAWNQRLESAFLADLLTASVVAAGEEAYAVAAGGTSISGTGLQSASSICLGAMHLSGSALPAPPAILYSPPSLSLSLSLGFFRQHAEQAIRASVAAASASGAPGILLSISPHCNAWDDSLIAEWEQQGFTFPHQHLHLQQHSGCGHAPPERLPRPSPQSRPLPARQAATLTEESRAAAGQAADVGAPPAAAPDAEGVLESELTLGLGPADGDTSAPVAVQQQQQLAAAAAASEEDGLVQQMQQAAAAGVAVDDGAANPFLQPLEFVQAPSASTLLSPFAAAASTAVAGAGVAASQLGPGPQQERSGVVGGIGQAPAGLPVAEAQPTAAGVSEAQPAAEDTAPEEGVAAGAAAGAGVEALPPTGDSASALLEAAASEAAIAQQEQPQAAVPQPPADAIQPGAQERQPPPPEQQSRTPPPPPHQQQPQSAVMVLQGQRMYNHQRIFVTCMFRRSRDRNLCDPFQVKQIDYYHRSSDVPLIRYIKMCTQLGWTCPGVGCPEPFTAHESVFFFGCHKLTIFYSTLPPIQALPGEEKNQIWHWTRPIGRGLEGAAACRRVPLSQDACYISMGRFLELSFSADGLDVFGRSMHYDHVRYFGLGRTLVCMFPERTSVYVMQLPDVVMSYSHQAQAKWLRQEGGELAQEANDAFDLIELMLGESPHFGGSSGGGAAGPGSWEVAAAYAATAGGGGGSSAAAAIAVSYTAGTVADASAAGGETPGFTPGSSPGTAAASASAASASAVLAPLLVAVRKDRQSFLGLVAECMARCAPPSPSPAPQGAAGAMPWDELVMSGVRELNRLRSVLAKAVLQWASRLQDPAGFMAHYSRVTSGGGAAGRSVYRSQPQLQPPPQQLQPLPQPQPLAQLPPPAPPSLSSSPRTTTVNGTTAAPAFALDAGSAAAAAAASASGGASFSQPFQAQEQQPSFAMSEGSLSLFGSTSPAVAAYRLGLMAGQQQPNAPPPSEAASFTSAAVSEQTGDHQVQQQQQQQAQDANTAAPHALPIPIVPHTNGPLSVHAVAEMVAQQELRGGGELLEGSRALLGASGGAVAAAAAAAAAAQHAAAAGCSSHSHGGSRSDNPTEGVVGSGGGAPPLAGHHGGDAGRVLSQSGGLGVASAGVSLKRVSPLGRLSVGGGVQGLDAAAGAGLLGGGGAAVHASSHGGGAGPGGGVGGGGGGLRGSSLPRSASVSTIGDIGDMSYMAGIGGDSGAEDNDDGEEGREEADDEEPDHDTFLAFMGSGPHGGGARAFQTGSAGGRGPGGAGPGGRPAALGGRGATGDDVLDEMADGAYYYRALFSHGVAPDGGGEEAAQPLRQPPQPLLLQQAAQHPLLAGEGEGEEGETEQDPQPHTGPGPGLSSSGSHSTSRAPGSVAQSPGAGGAPQSLHSTGALAIGSVQPDAVAVSEPMPLVPAAEPFGGSAAGAAAAAATTFSRRQLMVSVRRRLESVAAATVGGGSLARGFLPLPGRATMPPGVNDTIIPIFDGEPTSIIAYALSTRAYQQQINAGYKSIFGKARADGNRDRDRDREPTGAAATAAPTGVVVSDQQLLPMSQQQQQQQQGTVAGGGQGGSQAVMPTSAAAAGGAGDAFGLPPQGAAGASATTAASGHPAVAGNGAAAPSAATATAGPAALGSSPPLHAPPPQMPVPPLQMPPAGAVGGSPDAEWWTVLTSKDACHVRVAFEDEARSMPWARARFSVTAHFAPQFAELRRRSIQGGEAAFVASMCRCKRWESRGGKSNAYFAKTRDDRYIIKSLSKSEKASFVNFAPHYFAHMGRHLLNRDSPTCLAKVLGVYSVAFKPQPGSAGLEGAGGGGPAGATASAALIKELKDREFSQDLLVMENCFYDRPVARIYDLKGSERNRFNADAASRPEDHLEVHLDDNLRRSMHTNPIFVDARSRHQMEAAVWADTSFLAGQDVMDYSLLVGVDKENGVLALAIIDFIRQYTWDKQLETWVKSSGMLGGNGKEPTIISPKQYMRRFRAAMQQYFTAVPGSAGSEVPKDPDAAA